jgi:DNA-directed RNA polymerase I, II, and III subunit RPABC2
MELSDSEYDSDNLSTTSSTEGGATKKKAKRPAFLEEEEDYIPSEEDEDELNEERDPENNDPDAENSDIDSNLSEEEDDENEEDEEINEEDIPLPQAVSRSQKKTTKKRGKSSQKPIKEDDDEDDLDYTADDDEEIMEDRDEYYQKIKHHVERSRIFEEHPELRKINHEEIEALCQVIRDAKGRIIDPLHTTLPFLTKYEKADILGKRAAQINEGAPLFIEVDPSIIDGSLIALKEFEERKIPFIIQRPLPNGAMEYWRLQDLEVL